MTAVLLLGDIAGSGAGAAAERIELARTEPADLGFLEVVSERLRDHGEVLAVYPSWSWRSRAAERLVRVARGALGTDRVAGVPLGLPPLALSLVADRLAALAPHVVPGALAGVARKLPDEIVAGAWVRRVTGFRYAPVPLRAHLASYLPGGFVVTVAPAARIQRVSGRRTADLGAGPAARTLLVAGHGDDDRRVRRTLVPALRPETVTAVPAQPSGTAFWGTADHLEFVAFGDDLPVARPVAGRHCPWCDAQTALPNCPFCAMRQETGPRAATRHVARHSNPEPVPDRPARVAPGRHARTTHEESN